MMPQCDTEWVAEETLADELNVPRSVIHDARELQDASNIDRDGPWVVWKKKAATDFASTLGLQWPPVNPPVEQETAELTVTSVPGPDGRHFPNPNIIRAKKPDGALVDVRVLKAGHFAPTLRDNKPMTFRAKKSRHGSHWELIGREPRFRRAW